MKYVVIESHGVESPIIFPEWIKHDEVLKGHEKVVSAGFCSFSVGENGDGSTNPSVDCWGRSVSLKVKSRGEEDEDLIRRTNKFCS